MLGRPGERLAQRGVELGAVGDEHRAADLGDQLGPQLLLLGLEGGLQLEQAALAEARGRVAQSVVSKARRAAPTAASMSAAVPSATGPSTSSVAGLTLSKVAPPLGVDELAVDQQPPLARRRAHHTSSRFSTARRPWE